MIFKEEKKSKMWFVRAELGRGKTRTSESLIRWFVL